MAKIEGKKIDIPDFGQLVMDKFVAHAGKEILNWPAMDVEKSLLILSILIKQAVHWSLSFHTTHTLTFEKGGCFWECN